MFSKACEYAIRAVIYLAQISTKGKRSSLVDIAEEIGSPNAFTAKILQQLTKNNYIVSIKGPNGGFYITDERLQTLKLADIVRLMDGDKLFTGCALGLPECNSQKPCPLHHEFLKIRNEIQYLLENSHLEEISDQLTSGMTFLKR
ncbi:transcriptional regulator [Echinicola strongylocentroti]|uniref:Transcriptional regulator n=1 Tax=Echinicola strongylocentroti TaxID=1795355 RepID=A0A2Z4IEJ0_9BACT|nr:Rrf2 family transcriptional regulator [Echinicola strongylocentroti]AWW28853.1 transcriptional regulator [Echinicola strongylocentroti]